MTAESGRHVGRVIRTRRFQGRARHPTRSRGRRRSSDMVTIAPPRATLPSRVSATPIKQQQRPAEPDIASGVVRWRRRAPGPSHGFNGVRPHSGAIRRSTKGNGGVNGFSAPRSSLWCVLRRGAPGEFTSASVDSGRKDTPKRLGQLDHRGRRNELGLSGSREKRRRSQKALSHPARERSLHRFAALD